MMKLTTYNKYKDSGIEWLGDVPEHWEVIRMKKLSKVRRGASPRPIADPKYFEDNGEYAWVRIADVSASKRYLEKTTQTLSKLGASLSVKLQPNSFFLSIAGTVGKPIINKIKCCIHDGFVYFPELKSDGEFLYFIFSTGLPYQGLGKLGTQLNLNTETVGCISIPLPPKNESNSIVNYLDQVTTKIDKKINLLTQKIKHYQDLKTALINNAVTKGLDDSVEMKDSGVEWIGEIPKHWNIKRIDSVFIERSERVSDTNFPPLSVTKNGIVPQLSNAAKTSHNDNRRRVNKGDFVINSRSDRKGSSGLSSYTGSVSVINIVLSPTRIVSGEFYHHLFRSFLFTEEFYRQGKGIVADLWSTRYSVMKTIQVPIPPKSEQEIIANFLDEKTSIIDKIISTIITQIEHQKELRKTLINDVVTGKVKVESNN